MPMIDGQLAFAASAAVARQPIGRSAPLVRVLGIYIAGSAGTIQLLDILVDRLGLSDRLFLMAIILAIIGIPIIAAAALLFDAASAERRPPATAAQRGTAHARVAGTATTAAAATDHKRPGGIALARAPALVTRVELALSYHRIAELRRTTAGPAAAQPHIEAFIAEAEAIVEELRTMVEEVRGNE